MNRNDIAHKLIAAVQAADISALGRAIETSRRFAYREYQLKPQHERGMVENLINVSIDPLGLTALHVAVAMYANETADKETLNLIVGILLDRGADPFVPFGQKFRSSNHGPVMTDPGTTLFMQFRGEQLPPALRRWIAAQREDQSAYTSFPMQRRRRAEVV